MSDLTIFAFPVNLILAAAFSIAVYLGYGRYRESDFLHGWVPVTVVLTLSALFLAVEGTWKLGLQHNPLFWLTALCAMFLVAFATLDAVRSRRRFSHIATHLGFFLILAGTFFGAPDFTEVSMRVGPDMVEKYAAGSDGLTVPMNFGVRLKEFRLDFYDDKTTPKQYTSTVEFISEGRPATVKSTSVNHPCLYRGWLVYQSDYDHENESYSVLRLVRDPWLQFSFLGMLLLALGALLGIGGIWRSKVTVPVAIVLAIVFAFVSMARVKLGTLAPALRSLWFVPHLIFYMLAYSLLAIALVYGCVAVLRFKKLSEDKLGSAALSVRNLLATSSAMLVAGMLCGSVWAKMAWGDYWTWDPKECWAAVTWLITLAGTHLPFAGKNFAKRKNLIIIVLVVLAAFLAMQVTWYGVNWLPSAQFSMHTYNS